MKPNDDIVGQTITNIVSNHGKVEIYLSNGMRIRTPIHFTIENAGVEISIHEWITIRNGKQIRTRVLTK